MDEAFIAITLKNSEYLFYPPADTELAGMRFDYLAGDTCSFIKFDNCQYVRNLIGKSCRCHFYFCEAVYLSKAAEWQFFQLALAPAFWAYVPFGEK